MTLHAVIAWLKYRLRAQNRHGVHSPFVYHLNDVVLKDRSKRALPDKIRAHYSNHFLIREISIGEPLPASRDKLLLIVKGIHANPAATADWKDLCQNQAIPLTIDLHKAGLIFFDNAFKEKQHFTLRYQE